MEPIQIATLVIASTALVVAVIALVRALRRG